MNEIDIQAFREDILANMTGNILPYWMHKMVDEERGGFYGRRDGFDNLVPDAPKGAILYARLLWSFAAAYRVWPDPELREAIVQLMHIFFDIMEDPQSHHLGLFFDEEWNRRDGEQSFGHDIEASWLLMETALVLNDKHIIKNARSHTRRIAEAALEGLCPDGAMVYEQHASGARCNERPWWVQAEGVIGLVYLYRYHGVDEALPMAIHSWNYIKENIVDNKGGEWYWSRLAAPDNSSIDSLATVFDNGTINHKDNSTINRHNDRAGFWKCPYHNSRMCLEVYTTLTPSSAHTR